MKTERVTVKLDRRLVEEAEKYRLNIETTISDYLKSLKHQGV